MFPQEPRELAGGCMHTLTQTTENRSSQARVRGDYYVPSLAIGQGSLSRVLPLRGQFVDTLVLQVIAWIMRQHMRQKDWLFKPFHSVLLGGAGQRTCTVPTSATQRFTSILSQKGGAFIPSHERRRDFPRRNVNDQQERLHEQRFHVQPCNHRLHIFV
jgi:hypothetical protein